MNELANVMTVKELANVLGKDESTIRKIGKELFPESFRNGLKTYLNEGQVTAIKLQLGKNSELPKTNLEKELIIQQAMIFQQEKIRVLEKENEEMKPKAISYDIFINTENVHDMSEVAKMVKTGRNKLFRLLRENNVLKSNNEPYQQYVDNKYFEVKQKVIATGESKAVTKVTAKGIIFIEKFIKKLGE